MLLNIKDKTDLIVYSYEHMDDLSFVGSPKTYAASYLFEEITDEKIEKAESLVKEKLFESGWEGDGTLGIIWLPPFVLTNPDTYGLYVWHVKQSNNGTSWIASTTPLHFKELAWQNRKTPKGRPVHILQTNCEHITDTIKEMTDKLTKRLSQLKTIEDSKEKDSISSIIIEHTYCLLVQEFQSFLDDCYLVLLQESMTEGNFFNIKLPLPKAKFSIDTDGIDHPHMMGEDMENWLIKQQIISSIWKAFMFESFQLRVSAIPKSVGLKWDSRITQHLRTAAVIRNCFQHHFGQLSGDCLKVLGKDVKMISICSGGKEININKWEMIDIHPDEFLSLCRTITEAVNMLSNHVHEHIRKRYYVSENHTTIPKLFS